MWARLSALSFAARALAVALVVTGGLPVAAAAIALCEDWAAATVVRAHPGLVQAATCLLAGAAVFAFEPPRSMSPLAYARQLRARFLELQSTIDADDRRRPGEGKEKEDDRVPSEP